MKSFLHNVRFNRFTIALVAMLVAGGAFALHAAHIVAAHTFVVAHNLLQLGGIATIPLQLGVVADESPDKLLLATLGRIEGRLGKIDDIEKSVKKNADDYELVTKLIEEVKATNVALQKQILETRSARIRRGGEVSIDCARHLGALGLIAALKTPAGDLKQHQVEMCHRIIKETLGIEAKSALTSSDIPLPTAYSGEVVELVYEYGQARRYGTVFPLGAGVVKLPKLTTDTAFGLLAQSVAVTEVSPAVAFVTFTAEKFGGLIRLPSEIDEDSIVPMGQFIARYSARQIALCEDYQFFRSTGAGSGQNGTGEGLTKVVVTDTNFIYNTNTTSSGGKTKPSDMTLSDLRVIRSMVHGAVLQRAKYYMHPTYESALVAFNTSATVTPYMRGNGTAPATLDGFEIVWCPSMPAFSTGATVSVVHVIFGDASFQYLGTRGGVRFDTSREAAFATDEILIRAMERMTVAYMATKAMSGLRCTAS